MNREHAETLWPIIKAFSEGKTVQRFNNGWVSYSESIPDGHIDLPHKWRVKPEPKEFWTVIYSNGQSMTMGWSKEWSREEAERHLKHLQVVDGFEDAYVARVREILDD